MYTHILPGAKGIEVCVVGWGGGLTLAPNPHSQGGSPSSGPLVWGHLWVVHMTRVFKGLGNLALFTRRGVCGPMLGCGGVQRVWGLEPCMPSPLASPPKWPLALGTHLVPWGCLDGGIWAPSGGHEAWGGVVPSPCAHPSIAAHPHPTPPLAPTMPNPLWLHQCVVGPTLGG